MISKQKTPVFILAGGLGTRLSEETQLKPKPMVEIGGLPMLVHIMRWYYSFGFDDFVICAGYRSWEIKQYFLSYQFRKRNLEIDHRSNLDRQAQNFGDQTDQEKWRVRVVETGDETMTGGRVARAFDEIAKTEPFEHFALTYGDGLSDLDLDKELTFHHEHGRIGTVIGVHPIARFGELDVHEGKVQSFLEKPQSRQGLINGGFFFFKKEFRKYLSADAGSILERKPLADLAKDGELMVHPHTGFWQPMDTLRDKILLEDLWGKGDAPWLSRK